MGIVGDYKFKGTIIIYSGLILYKIPWCSSQSFRNGGACIVLLA